MEWWIWLVGGMLLLLVEIVTPGGFYFLFFGVGALLTGVLAVFGAPAGLVGQALVFVGFSSVAVALFRKPMLEKMNGGRPAPNVDSLVGETAVLTAAVAPGEFGQAELRWTTWKVRNMGAVTLQAGHRCMVEAVSGLTLHVRAES
jgi:inner membrane protein